MLKLRRNFFKVSCVIVFTAFSAGVVWPAGVPYVTVRVGTDEHPGGNNHMRMQLAVNPSSGAVHMLYKIFSNTPSQDLRLYFYNSYDCGGSNALDLGSTDRPMSQIFGFDPTRPREIGDLGGILNFPNCRFAPVPYGNRLINQGAGSWTMEGTDYMSDGAECLNLFSMNTTPANGNTQFTNPVMYILLPISDRIG